MRSASLTSLSIFPILALLAGCPAPSSSTAPTGPGAPPPTAPAPSEADKLVTELGVYADRMCACADETCRNATHTEAETFSSANRASIEALPPERIKATQERYVGCMSSGAVGEFSLIKDRMCACTDVPCSQVVNADFEKWMGANQSSQGSQEQQSEARQIAEEYMACLAKATGGGGALPAMGQKCGDGDACAGGLECVKYYGIGGPRGGQFTSCEIRCGKGKPACGDGLQCTTIADGPGQVCRAK